MASQAGATSPVRRRPWVQGSGFRVQGSGFRVQGLGLSGLFGGLGLSRLDEFKMGLVLGLRRWNPWGFLRKSFGAHMPPAQEASGGFSWAHTLATPRRRVEGLSLGFGVQGSTLQSHSSPKAEAHLGFRVEG